MHKWATTLIAATLLLATGQEPRLENPIVFVTQVPVPPNAKDLLKIGGHPRDGHEHAFKPLRRGRWINVSVEQTLYRPLDVRTQIIPLAKALVARRIPPGSRRPNGCGTRASRESDRGGLKHRWKSDADGLGTAGMAGRPHRPGKP